MSPLHLVGHDGSARGDDALALSRALAPNDDARRLIVHVIERPAPDLSPNAGFRRGLLEDAEAELAPLRASLHAAEELRVVDAPSVAHGLHALAEECGATLLVVGPSHRGKIGYAVLGTVADRLLHGSPCPVAMAIAGFAGSPQAIDRVVLAYDGSAEAESALAFAGGVAGALHASVDVVCVQMPPAYYDLAGVSGIPPTLLEEPVKRAAALAARAVEALGAGHVGATATPLWPTGDAIAAAAAGADLVVCGSRAYGPLRHVVLGSTGHYVLHHAPCSVVIVPRGNTVAVAKTHDAELLQATS